MATVKVLSSAPVNQEQSNESGGLIESAMDNVKKFMVDANKVIQDQPVEDGIMTMQYPLNMGKNDPSWDNAPILSFTIFEQNAASFNMLNSYRAYQSEKIEEGPELKTRTRAIITLPMPVNGLTDSISNNVGAGDNSFLQELLTNSYNAFNAGSDLMDSMKRTGEAAFGTVKTEIGVQAKKATNQYNTNRGAGKTIAGNRGFHAYQGTEPRSFTFNWRLVPKTLAELKEVAKIVYVLKIAALPDFLGDENGYSVMKAPPLVAVKEVVIGSDNAKIRYTPRFYTNICQIQNVRSTLGADGMYPTFDGTAGDPVVIDIEVTVKELVCTTATQFKEAMASKNWTADVVPNRTSPMGMFKSSFGFSSKDLNQFDPAKK